MRERRTIGLICADAWRQFRLGLSIKMIGWAISIAGHTNLSDQTVLAFRDLVGSFKEPRDE